MPLNWGLAQSMVFWDGTSFHFECVATIPKISSTQLEGILILFQSMVVRCEMCVSIKFL